MMKNLYPLLMLGLCLLLLPKKLFSQEKLTLSTGMITNESGFGDAKLLADEQGIAGNPANGTGGSPSTYWFPGWSGSNYPAHAYIDLGETYEISQIFLRDIHGTGGFTVSYGSPGSWTVLFTDNLNSYQTWNQHNVDIDARYLRFTRASTGANMSELVIYGSNLAASDTLAPTAISTLQVDSVTINGAYLKWTASGDDGNIGKAHAYDIRYYTKPIDNSNYALANIFSPGPSPDSAGTSQTVFVSGLNSRTTYYFTVKVLDEALNISELSNVVSGQTLLDIGGNPEKIMLTTEMILNESAQGDATFLVDEQTTAGDPENNNGGSTANRWSPGDKSLYYPAFALIDLGTNYHITKIYLYDDIDYVSPDSISVYTGEPFSWDSLLTDGLSGNGAWKEFLLDSIYSRYIRVELYGKNSRMSEIVVYGSAQDSVENLTPAITQHPRPFMEDFIGINAFVDDPIGRLEAVGHIREYHDWMWDEGNTSTSYPGYPNNENKFNPGAADWKFDNFYQNLQNLRIDVFPAIKRNVLWLVNNQYNLLDNKPISSGESAEDPASYAEHADHMFQYAARYGQIAVADNLLKLAGNQPRISGTDLLGYYENWSEHDRWWQYRDDYFTPYEYAAMSSADYDGHMGTMGNTVGIKNADSTAKLVMSGLARPSLEHIRAIKLWADRQRNGDFPLDVITLHHYSNDSGIQGQGSQGISPEADGLKERMKTFVDYRNQYLPGKEMWITEFGYDTHVSSPQRAPSIGSYSPEEVQGQWIIRSFLALAVSGVDRATLYMLRDVDPNSAIQYKTSGLTESKDSLWRAKPSWYYVYTMKNRLTGMQFEKEEISGHSQVKVYKFKNPSRSEAAYSVWCPTSDGTVVNDYTLNLLNTEIAASQVKLTDGYINGVDSSLTITNSQVTLDVTEKPVFVIVTDGSNFEPLYTFEEKLALDTSMVVNESGLGDAWKLVDEQILAGQPKYGKSGTPIDYWHPSWSGADYPANAYIDLGTEKDITKIYLMDRSSQGDMKISVGTPGNWTELFTDDLTNYNVWKAHVVDVNSRYIRITTMAVGAEMSEIVVYAKSAN